MTVVLDSSAVLALILREPGSVEVASYLKDAHMSTVNYAETLGRLAMGGMPIDIAHWLVQRMQIRLHPFSMDQAYAAGGWQPDTHHRGLSLGDRACFSLGRELDAPVVTADRVWTDIDLGVEVVLVR